jgi:hypothetical protein
MERERFQFNINLLTDFISRKLSQYVEPERAGTPKGELIGLSKKKYHASLLCLTSCSLKEIAFKVKMPYASVRRWNTEETFTKQIRKNIDEFFGEAFIVAVGAEGDINAAFGASYKKVEDAKIISVLSHLSSIYPDYPPLLKDLKKLKGKRIIFELGLQGDASLYGQKLLRALAEKIFDRGLHPKLHDPPGFALSLMFAFGNIAFAIQGKDPQLDRMIMEMYLTGITPIEELMEKDIASTLEKEGVSLETRREITNHFERKNETFRAVLDLLRELK